MEIKLSATGTQLRQNNFVHVNTRIDTKELYNLLELTFRDSASRTSEEVGLKKVDSKI